MGAVFALYPSGVAFTLRYVESKDNDLMLVSTASQFISKYKCEDAETVADARPIFFSCLVVSSTEAPRIVCRSCGNQTNEGFADRSA